MSYEQFAAEFISTLAPEGLIEKTFAHEIAGAAWRLHNCRLREAAAEVSDAEQKSIDRIRTSAQIAMRRCLAELRCLQAERPTRDQPPAAPQQELGSFCKNAPEEPAASFCKTPIPFPNTPRTRPCPCNSGKKYKNCCGVNAPPVVSVFPQRNAPTTDRLIAKLA